MDETLLAYLAGFFDGEGCIALYMRKAWTAQVTVSQIDTDVLDLYAQLSPTYTVVKVNGGHVSNYTWYSRSAIPVVRALYPYLRVKKEQAELFLEWASYSDGRQPGKPFPLEVRVRIGEIAMELKTLKHWDRDARGK